MSDQASIRPCDADGHEERCDWVEAYLCEDCGEPVCHEHVSDAEPTRCPVCQAKAAAPDLYAALVAALDAIEGGDLRPGDWRERMRQASETGRAALRRARGEA